MTAPGYGPAPYGYRVEIRKELLPVPEEQAVLWLIAKLRRGGRSLQQIADQLDALGIRTRADAPFTRQGLHLILRREFGGAELEATG